MPFWVGSSLGTRVTTSRLLDTAPREPPVHPWQAGESTGHSAACSRKSFVDLHRIEFLPLCLVNSLFRSVNRCTMLETVLKHHSVTDRGNSAWPAPSFSI